ncbi:MAG: fibronectin type III domain-containing protein [bacterium]|nr:fibronectin type III domain-containing protein [bacterium]
MLRRNSLIVILLGMWLFPGVAYGINIVNTAWVFYLGGTESDTCSIVDFIMPASPTLISVVNPGLDGRLNLEWTPGTNTNLSGYKIHYGTTSGIYTQIIDTGSITTTYQLVGLTNGQTYYIAVSAYDKAGSESNRSNEGFGIPTGPFTQVKIVDRNNQEINTVTTTVNGTLLFYLGGYDAGNNFIGYVNGTWTVHGGIGNCTPIYGTFTIFNPTTRGTGTISAIYATLTDTTVILVRYPPFIYPNPYYGNKHNYIYFGDVDENSIIQIFTIAGELVREIRVESVPQRWDVRNWAGEKIASGIYIYIIKDPTGNKKVGKLGVLR